MVEGPMSNRAAIALLMRQAGHGRLAVLGMLMVASSLTEGIGLVLLVPITRLVAEADDGTIQPEWLAPVAKLPLGWLLIAVVALVSLRALIVYASNESRRALDLELANRLRRMVHEAILGANWRWLARQNSADHASLIMLEADRAAGLMDQALSILAAAVTLFLLVAAAALISWQLTVMVVVLGVAAAFVLGLLRGRNAQEGEAYVRAHSELQRLVSNGLKHLRAARIVGAEHELAQNFARASSRLVELETRFFRAGHETLMLFQVIAVMLLAGMVFGALAMFAMPLAIFLPVVAIIARIVPLAGNIQQGMRGWRYNVPALASVQSLIAEARAQEEFLDHGAQAVTLEHGLELSNVTLRYHGRERSVFDGLNLKVAQGSILAVSGASGSGKSSLADILAGLVVPDSGEVLIDGMALDATSRIGWRRNVAYVEQEPYLFDGTIAENLSWGRSEVDEAEMWRALEMASAGFVRQLPDGLATRMGEGARQLSGGEKQRIALARALLGAPQLLILDEVSAGLDQDNCDAIIHSVGSLRGQCTVVLLSHDQRLIGIADQIVDLDRQGTAP
ncbi:MAG: ABC transporter ATP-binding protein [Alphaproteobacteria bacterium]|nr:MAG: ABC transporter ATP-binding protein [Alphaproteobacteria bacterium]